MSRPVSGPGPDIAGHRWVRPLGAGGFADVHLYRQLSPARDVAVKVLRDAGDSSGTHALAAEADALAAVAGHPAIVTLYGTGTTADGRAYLTMEYCPVADLADQVRGHPLALARALELMVPVCAAAETMHRSGLVHRDIKPANLMLTAWEQPVLADLGSTVPSGVVTSGGGFSLLWAAPEQYRPGIPAHPSQDVWALAATAWTLLAGHSPFETPGGDNSAAAVADRVRTGRLPALGRPDAPEELVVTLRGALVADPSARTRSALELAAQLQSVQARLGRPRTAALVQVAAPAPTALIDDQRTRVRAVPVADPTADPAVPAAQPIATAAPVDDPEITLPPGASVPAPHSVAENGDGSFPRHQTPLSDPWREMGTVPITRHSRSGLRPWVVALVVLVAVVATAAGVSGVLLGAGGTTQRAQSAPAQPRDPVAEPPAPVTGLTGTLTKGRVYWTWTGASGAGLRYIFTITRPDAADITKETTLTGTDVAAVTGQNCIEIAVVTQTGRESSPASSCLTVP